MQESLKLKREINDIYIIFLVPVVFLAVRVLIWSLPVKKKKNSNNSIVNDMFYAETQDKCRTVTEVYETIKDIKANGGEYLKNKKE